MKDGKFSYTPFSNLFLVQSEPPSTPLQVIHRAWLIFNEDMILQIQPSFVFFLKYKFCLLNPIHVQLTRRVLKTFLTKRTMTQNLIRRAMPNKNNFEPLSKQGGIFWDDKQEGLDLRVVTVVLLAKDIVFFIIFVLNYFYCQSA